MCVLCGTTFKIQKTNRNSTKVLVVSTSVEVLYICDLKWTCASTTLRHELSVVNCFYPTKLVYSDNL